MTLIHWQSRNFKGKKWQAVSETLTLESGIVKFAGSKLIKLLYVVDPCSNRIQVSSPQCFEVSSYSAIKLERSKTTTCQSHKYSHEKKIIERVLKQ